MDPAKLYFICCCFLGEVTIGYCMNVKAFKFTDSNNDCLDGAYNSTVKK